MFNQLKKSKITVLLLSLFCFISCTNPYWGNYIERNEKENLKLLKEYKEFNQNTQTCPLKTVVDPERAEEIKNFFADKNMPEEWLDSSKSTWERAKAIALWVSDNVKHSNPNPPPAEKNCIDLYKWNKEHTGGFNCRMHSIMLNELLLVAGIENRFITCLPKDNDDPDCHVVNIVWLPEYNKWAMIDSDMTEYIVDENNIPLSLAEIRSYLVEDKDFKICAFEGYKIDREYLHAYWIKNLFAFNSHTLNQFSVESGSSGQLVSDDKHFFLYPKKLLMEEMNIEYKETEEKILTTDETQFWGL